MPGKSRQPAVVLCVTNDTLTDQRVHKMAMTLHKAGYEVVIAGRRSAAVVSQPTYARIVRLPVIFNKKAIFYAEFNIRLFFYLLFTRADIITANDLDTLLGCSLACAIRRKKLVYDSHEFFTESPEILNKPFVRGFWKCLENYLVKHVDAAITVSPAIARIYRKIYGRDFIVVRNVPTENKTPQVNFASHQWPDEIPFVLYQGSLNIGRGLEMAIRAMKHVSQANLVIAGGGDIEKELKELARESGLEGQVFFTGRLPFRELSAITPMAVLGLSIEQDMGRNYRYALPNKLFDYIHYNVPAVVSDLPEMRNIIMKYGNGVILPSYDEHSLADIINQLLDDPGRLSELKKNCAAAARDLYWEKESQIVEGIYHELLV
jgi:glycosyltransferase involved in cell wall biosynthesis